MLKHKRQNKVIAVLTSTIFALTLIAGAAQAGDLHPADPDYNDDTMRGPEQQPTDRAAATAFSAANASMFDDLYDIGMLMAPAAGNADWSLAASLHPVDTDFVDDFRRVSDDQGVNLAAGEADSEAGSEAGN